MRRLATALAALTLLAAVPVGAAHGQQSDGTVHFQWIRHPTDKDAADAMAKYAPKFVGEARMVLSCAIANDGSLADCRVTEAGNPDPGLAQAALSLAPLFQLSGTEAGGHPLAGTSVRIPMTLGRE